MKNRELFEVIKKNMAIMTGNGATDEMIDKFSEELEVDFPTSYKLFLKEFGWLGVAFYNVKGIERMDLSGMCIFTQRFREQISLPKEYVVVSERSTRNPDTHILTCLDTARMVDGECPVVKYDVINKIVMDYTTNFDEAFEDGLMGVYNERLLPRLKDSGKKNVDLPLGMGFKACWITVVGSCREDIIKAFDIKKSVCTEYKKGLETVFAKTNQIMVTADYDGKNYVFFSGTPQIFEDVFLSKCCEKFPTTYGYLTHRVTEIHGFFKISDGKVERLYFRDENMLKNMGEPLPEEIKNKIVLPRTIDEIGNRSYTRMNENVIYQLALKSSGVKVGDYPYEDVVVGEYMF